MSDLCPKLDILKYFLARDLTEMLCELIHLLISLHLIIKCILVSVAKDP